MQPKIQSRHLPNINEKSEKSGPVRDWEELFSRRLRVELGLMVRALVSLVYLTEGCWRYSPSVCPKGLSCCVFYCYGEAVKLSQTPEKGMLRERNGLH
jgi:hypothetical protein